MDADTFSYIWKGALLGIHSGFAPGPLSTILITESLLHGRKSGMKIAFVPFLTDVPVICIVIPLLYTMSTNISGVIAVISLVGACILCYLGYEGISVRAEQFQRNDVPSISLGKAVFVNFFNPNLYLYWLTICGALAVSALHSGLGTMLAFLAAFYVCITAIKLGMAFTVGSVRQALNWQIMIWINRLLGVVMFCFAAMFFWKGCQMLGIWQ